MAANGSYDFEFRLYDASGTQVGTTNTLTGVVVTNGVFTVELNFGASAFPGAARFLEIAVKKPADPSYTTLTPRQQIYSAPYSYQAANATNAATAISATTADNALQLGGIAASQYVL